MTPPPLSLTILRKGDTNLIDVAERGTLIPRSEVRVDDAFLRQLVAEVTRVASPGYSHGAGHGIVQELQRIGAVLFSQLLPEPARHRLRTAEPCDLYLRLDEQLVHLPWELCHDGEQFLVTKFRLGRQVITSAPVRSMSVARQERNRLRVLLIADPTETLPHAGEEAERLCHFFSTAPGVEVTLLGGRVVRKAPLLAALQSHDLVHFAGHSQYDPHTPSHSGWQLYEDIVTVEELGQLAHPPLLVFSNSCQAGATVAWGASSHYDAHALGIGSAFLLAGVKNYIGTFWMVPDEESELFATVFYPSLTAGQSLGAALYQARHTIIAQRGWQGLTWASYMLYGDPAVTLLSTAAHPLSRVSAVAQSQRAQVLQRKLAAILSADVQGYSRLMEEDEVATIRTLTAYREVMTALIQHHHGRVVDATGDNLLAEFGSAVDAVQGAVAIQKALKTRNADLPLNRQMKFRIGINVGDVIVEGERLYGDGVNIAARLEALAEGGGICLSGTVYDQVKNKLALPYESLGERTVKNIAEPVGVYRVLVTLPTTPRSVPSSEVRVPSAPPLPAPNPQLPTPTVVGRELELAQLRRSFEKALRGERQVVFVTGEPGIGKTTLVDAFLSGIREQGTGNSNPAPTDSRSPIPDPWIAQGQCIEQYGAGEAYLPVLSALGQLCREPEGQRLVEILGKYAPTWLIQMPALVNAADLEVLQRKTHGATRERMLREMAEALEAITAERPLVLWLEDLHWSDYSTLDLIAFLARRRQPARLLVLGTSRPVEGTEHSLRTIKQELQLHGQCQEIAVRLLDEAAVGEYLAVRFDTSVGARRAVPLQLTHLIHQRTEGNPLFMVNVVNELLTREKLDEAAVVSSTPTTIRQLIEQQLARLNVEEQSVLEIASVAGIEFSAAAVAAGIDATSEEVEQRCAALARRGQFLQAKGAAEWPDGTVAARYSFIHALYQEVVYERVTAGRRMRLHQRIGERLEAAYGKRSREIAAELAVYFERGRDSHRAVQYLRQAGENATRRSAHREAISLLTKGFELLKTLPDTLGRTQQELRLQIALGAALIATKGYGAPEVEYTYAQAYELCQQGGSPRQLISILQGLHLFYFVRGKLRKAQDLAEQMYQVAQRVSTPTALMVAHGALGISLFRVGELTAARAHLEQAWALCRPQDHDLLVIGSWGDPGVSYLSHIAVILWYLGYPDQALKNASAALRLAHEGAHPFSLAFALAYAVSMDFLLQEAQASREHVEALIALATDQQFPDWLALGTAMRGAGFVKQGEVKVGMAQLQQGLAEMQALGQEIGRPAYLADLAQAYGKQGQTDEGLRVMEEALAVLDRIGERYYEAELYREKGELILQSKGPSPISQVEKAAEGCFWQAIEIARQQQAKSWELRAVMSLSRLWRQQGKRAEARQLLAEIHGWFTEGFDTADLKEAKALLDALEDRGVERQEGKDSPKRRTPTKRAKKEPKPQRPTAIRSKAGATAPMVSGERVPALPLPGKPSLAVLPFANMSSDPEQEYFSDGMTDTLITDLSRLSGLFVIARHSSFTYKGKAVKLQQVSRELGVRYVVEGSVQKADTRVRINVQLIDATTGYHLWAERYDRELTDIFALQDEITQKIVDALRVEVAEAELARVRRIPTHNLTAYDSLLRGAQYFFRFTIEANAQARQLFARAVALDPPYADAYVALGWTYVMERFWHWSQDPQTRERAVELAQRALALDDSLPLAHGLLSWVYLGDQQLDQARAEAERAIALDPNYADSYALRAQVLNIAGQPQAALESIEQAMRLNPHYPDWYLVQLGFTYRWMGRLEEAIAAQKEVLSRNPHFLTAYTELAVGYVQAWDWQTSQDPQTLEQAFAIAQRALALNDAFPWAHMLLGFLYLQRKQPDQALAEAKQAIALDPYHADAHADLAEILAYLGQPEQAVKSAEQAMRLNAQPPGWYSYGLGMAYRLMGRLEEAVAAQQRVLSQNPYFLPSHRELAVSYSELGREEEAQAAVAAILQLSPNYALAGVRQRVLFTDPAEVERTLTALRKTGLK